MMPATRSGSPVRSTAASPDRPSSATGWRHAAPARAPRAPDRRARRRPPPGRPCGRAGRSRTSRRAPAHQLGDLLERRLDVERAAEREPGVQQEPLADLGPSRRGHVLDDAHHQDGAAGAVADRRRLDEQPLLLPGGADDPAREQRLDVVGAVQEAVPRQVLVVEVAAFGGEEREAPPQLRQVEPIVRAAGVEHGPRGGVGRTMRPWRSRTLTASSMLSTSAWSSRASAVARAPPSARASCRAAASANRTSGVPNGARAGPRPARPCRVAAVGRQRRRHLPTGARARRPGRAPSPPRARPAALSAARPSAAAAAARPPPPARPPGAAHRHDAPASVLDHAQLGHPGHEVSQHPGEQAVAEPLRRPPRSAMAIRVSSRPAASTRRRRCHRCVGLARWRRAPCR